MKQALLLSMGLVLSHSVMADTSLSSVEQKASYTLATDLAKNFQQQGLKIDIEAFTLGLEDALNQRPLRLSEDEMTQAIATVKKQMVEKQQAERQAQGERNQKRGEAFLAEHAKKSGVQILENGIQYEVIKSGEGNSPTEDDVIFAHYEGQFIDGTVFDSSYERGTPLKFEMGNVIRGWGEVLKLMKPGDKWKVVIPSDLAYGERGAGDRIGPHQTLIFTIELIQFHKAET